ncbi:hypothetical protein ACWPKS_06115 [Coraliomargarita sp. W4R72]
MTFELFFNKVMPSVFELGLYLSLGVLIGVLLEVTGCIKGLSRIARPILALGNFPAECAAAFVAAFGSTKTAHSMLASAYRGGEINRRELVLGAVANSLPTTLMHLKFFAPLMISALGQVGLAYVVFVITLAVAVFLFAVIASRFLVEVQEFDAASLEPVEGRKKKETGFWNMLWSRWWRMSLRVLSVAIPVYTAITWIEVSGGFQWMASALPSSVESIFPVESMGIIVAQLSRTSAAVSATKGLLDAGTLTSTQAFFTLLAGYCLALPIKVLRRNLPSALSIFPDTSGFWIIGITQGVRMLIAVSMVGGYIAFAS